MKSIKEVYAKSRQSILEAQKNKINFQKVQLLEAIKSDLMITCKLKELSESKQHQVLNMLLTYWSPKKGINKAGEKFLNEGALTINESSTNENIQLFAQKEVKDHINEFMAAFATANGKKYVQRLQENLQYRTNKNIDFKSLFEMVTKIINKKIVSDNM